MSVEILETLESVEKLQSSSLSVTYYTATWCPPCKAIKPLYNTLSSSPDYSKIQFGQVDIDENNDAAAAASIRSVPTFVFVNGGETVTFSGADQNRLKEELDNLVNDA